MKPQLLALSILLGSAFLIVAAPAATAAGTCTFTATDSSLNTYTVTASPCTQTSPTSGTVGLGATITLQASTSNGAVSSVDFAVTTPTYTTSYYSSSTSPYTQTVTLSSPGTYEVNSYFCTSPSSCVTSPYFDSLSFQVQILVLNAVPLGAVSVLGISLAGLALFRRAQKKPLPA
jgi:hypothetical protein